MSDRSSSQSQNDDLTLIDAGVTVPRPEKVEGEVGDDSEALDFTQPLLSFGAITDALSALAQDEGPTALSGLLNRQELDQWAARAEWLEEEARCAESSTQRAEELLVTSELWALSGNPAHARTVIGDASDADAALCHRQRRQLAYADHDLDEVRETLLAEAQALEPEVHSSLPKGDLDAPASDALRAHCYFFLAELERLEGSGAAQSQKYLNQAAALLPKDPRPVLFKLARQLVLAASPPSQPWDEEDEDLTHLVQATRTLRRARDVDTGATPPEAPVTGLISARRALAHGQTELAGNALTPLFDDPNLGLAARWLAASLFAVSSKTRKQSLEALRPLEEQESSAARTRFLRSYELAESNEQRQWLLGERHSSTLSPAERLAAWALTDAPGNNLLPAAEAINIEDAELFALTWASLAAHLEPLPYHPPGSEAMAQLLFWQTLSDTDSSKLELLDFSNFESWISKDPLLDMALLFSATRANKHHELARLLLKWSEPELRTAAVWTSALLLELGRDAPQATPLYTELCESEALGGAALRARDSLITDLTLDVKSATRSALAQQLPESPARDFLVLESSLLDIAGQMDALLLARARIASNTAAQDAPKAVTQETLLQRLTSMQTPTPCALLRYLTQLHAQASGQQAQVAQWLREREAQCPRRQKPLLRTQRALSPHVDTVERTELLRKALADEPQSLGLYQLLWAAQPADVHSLAETWESLAVNADTDRASYLQAAAWFYETAGARQSAARLAQQANQRDPNAFSNATFERTALSTELQSELRERWVSELSTSESAPQKAWLAQSLARLDESRGESERQREWLWEAVEAQPDQLVSLIALEQFALENNHREILARLEPLLATQLPAKDGTAHLELAARIVKQQKGWPAALAVLQKGDISQLSAHGLRQAQALARRQGDDAVILEVTLLLCEQADQSADKATLLLEAARAAARIEQVPRAVELIEEAARVQPSNLLIQDFRAELLLLQGNASAAATAKEQVAQLSCVPSHQARAWYEAACLWLDRAEQPSFGQAALENAFELEPGNKEVFERLLQLLQVSNHEGAQRLIQRRLAVAPPGAERVDLEVMRAKLLAEVGKRTQALLILKQVLKDQPDHFDAVETLINVASNTEDPNTAEEVLLPVARSSSDPKVPIRLYLTLAELWMRSTQLERAEHYYREVIRRQPDNDVALEALPGIFKRLNRGDKVVELYQHQLENASTEADERSALLQLSRGCAETDKTHPRLEKLITQGFARWPHDEEFVVHAIELAPHNPAVAMLLRGHADQLLEKVVSDELDLKAFDVLALMARASERLKWSDCLQSVSDTLRNGGGQFGAQGGSALEPKQDQWLCPESFPLPLRNLLKASESGLDAAFPSLVSPTEEQNQTLRSLRERAAELAAEAGLSAPEVQLTSTEPGVYLVAQDAPAILLVGEKLLNEASAEELDFLTFRNLKLIQARAGVFSRLRNTQALEAVIGLLSCYTDAPPPDDIDLEGAARVKSRVEARISGASDQDTENARVLMGQLSEGATQLASSAQRWANRTALLATGNFGAACQALCRITGLDFGDTPEQRQSRLISVPELQDLLRLVTQKDLFERLAEPAGSPVN